MSLISHTKLNEMARIKKVSFTILWFDTSVTEGPIYSKPVWVKVMVWYKIANKKITGTTWSPNAMMHTNKPGSIYSIYNFPVHIATF